MPGTSRSEQLIDRLWGSHRTRSRLGRPAELDLGRILTAAMALADADGLAAVTLPRIAGELGVTGMSLYRYVGSKDELMVLLADAALGPPPAPMPDDAGWRERIRRWAHAERELYRRRPWLARLPISGPPAGPNQLSWMEAALIALSDTGLDWAPKLRVLTVISGYARQSSTLSQDLAAGRAATDTQTDQEQAYVRALAGRVTPDRFPEAAKLFASPVFTTPPGTSDFEFGLELILDGVAAQLPADAPAAHAPAPTAHA